jgi:hypothetical protein
MQVTSSHHYWMHSSYVTWLASQQEVTNGANVTGRGTSRAAADVRSATGTSVPYAVGLCEHLEVASPPRPASSPTSGPAARASR